MKTTLKAALAAVLLGGVATAAMAQEHDHGDRGGGARAQAPAAPQAAAPQAPAPQQHWNGGGMRQGGPAANPGFRGEGPRGEGFQRHDQAPAFQGQRFQGQAPPVQGQRFEGQRFQGQRFQGGGDQQRFDGGQRPQDGGRNWERQRGQAEVVPPTGPHGWDNRRDGREVRPGAGFEARGDHRADGRWANGARDGRWAGRGEHWQPGRFPPVFVSQQRFHVGRYHAPYGFYARSWGFGEFLPRGWYGPDYFIDDFLNFDLPYPPPGYEWVRVGDDALMIDQYTGRIVQVVRGIFW